jgi:hypothetical protein
VTGEIVGFSPTWEGMVVTRELDSAPGRVTGMVVKVFGRSHGWL